MIRINEVKVPVSHTEKDLEHKICRMLKIHTSDLVSWKIIKESLDARKKPELFYVYTIEAELKNEASVLKKKIRQVQPGKKKSYVFPTSGSAMMSHRPIVAGSGPAGLFCAYLLASHGYAPILIERGAPVEERLHDVEQFWKDGILNPESNVQFGEGGAGTFSDGKLNTLVKDPAGRNQKVLEIFIENGAPKSILYQNKPHIGTDLLTDIVRNMRSKIEAWGGEVRFHSKLTSIETDGAKLCAVHVNETIRIPAEILILAIGHSARDTFQMLLDQGLPMKPKAFAIGVRTEHPQELIDHAQYGKERGELPAAAYKLTATTKSGRGVYSFCMCPGGYVVNASSEPEMLAINGMSYHSRAGAHANSAIVVTINPEDFPSEGILSGMEFQRDLERAAFRAGKGKIPVQRLEDFRLNQKTTRFGAITPQMKGAFEMANLHEVLPDFLSEAILEGMDIFDRRIPGFGMGDALLSAVESRTSSPVRIMRDDTFQSEIRGVYPCGEGAGYAGGITSAAMDGIKVAEAVAVEFSPIHGNSQTSSEKINVKVYVH
jgi:hypothetical protein